ncbi:MAG: hypothetical protein VR64_02580 [Desulfatitalea sp. BRH_c12]|nr:MAG: hypothetical protein VR64_02580 [Desulfatitalea sp. BRH_c12]
MKKNIFEPQSLSLHSANVQKEYKANFCLWSEIFQYMVMQFAPVTIVVFGIGTGEVCRGVVFRDTSAR